MYVVIVNLVLFVYVFFYVLILQLKKELYLEIVKDVIRKTVKYVLRGLDGVVLQSYKGGEVIDIQFKGVSVILVEEIERNVESSSYYRKLLGVFLQSCIFNC